MLDYLHETINRIREFAFELTPFFYTRRFTILFNPSGFVIIRLKECENKTLYWMIYIMRERKMMVRTWKSTNSLKTQNVIYISIEWMRSVCHTCIHRDIVILYCTLTSIICRKNGTVHWLSKTKSDRQDIQSSFDDTKYYFQMQIHQNTVISSLYFTDLAISFHFHRFFFFFSVGFVGVRSACFIVIHRSRFFFHSRIPFVILIHDFFFTASPFSIRIARNGIFVKILNQMVGKFHADPDCGGLIEKLNLT